jgi:hypothetical protein
MSRRAATSRVAIVAAAFVGLMPWAVGARAQETKGEPSTKGAGVGKTVRSDRTRPVDVGKGASTQPTETLVIVVDGEPDFKEVDVQEQIGLGVTFVLRDSGKLRPDEPFPAERIKAEQLDRATFEVLKRFITEGSIPREGAAERAIEPDLKDDWRVHLGGPYALRKLVVTYLDLKTQEKTTKEYAPGDGSGSVKLTTVGRYRVTGLNKDQNVRPVKFEVFSTDGDKDLAPWSVEVPRDNTYWQVTIRDFPGDEGQLFDTLATHPRIANKTMKKQISERKFVLGSMLIKPVLEELGILNNVVKVTFYKPPQTDPSRAWMKFPLDPEEVQAELEKYRKMSRQELPRAIVKEQPVLAGEASKLSPHPAPARWYEIPATKEGGFHKEFELDQIDAWKGRGDRAVHYLIVWQLDDGWNARTGEFKDAQAYSIVSDGPDKAAAAVNAKEAVNWPLQIKRAGPAR